MSNASFRLARIIGALAVLAMVSACSTVKLGYNNLDEAAYWWLDGYVDFTDMQSPRVRGELGKLHAWHRANELPRYAGLLQRVEKLAAGDVTAAQACGVITEVLERLEVVAVQAEPSIASVAQGLEPDQLQHLERKYRRNNADWRKDWIDAAPAAVAEKRFKQMLERSETVYGGLDEPQRQALRKQLDQSTFDAPRVLADRERRQQDALVTLRQIAGAPARARLLIRGFLERARQPASEDNCRTIAAVHNSTTAAQRDVAVRRLRAWQRDVNELAARK